MRRTCPAISWVSTASSGPAASSGRHATAFATNFRARRYRKPAQALARSLSAAPTAADNVGVRSRAASACARGEKRTF